MVNWYWGAKHQILVLASEILASGGLAGELTSLSFIVAALNTAAALVNFEIRLKQTTATVLDNIWDTDNFISVYQNPSLTNTLVGILISLQPHSHGTAFLMFLLIYALIIVLIFNQRHIINYNIQFCSLCQK
jgi:hypothetical protein